MQPRAVPSLIVTGKKTGIGFITQAEYLSQVFGHSLLQYSKETSQKTDLVRSYSVNIFRTEKQTFFL
ncbi:unnamed protein product [Didymodactylos carnosus]|uniref:Uncharacterized protein n=1 Tax=Didymodactylos carnosus TaxID=1234261 RepID=A0A815EKV3_9BILA|nr:unnamed protein product [Didymodactylos carnosus]CAF1313804.1 unnamed protein product [Didymodactylos carnosus]CAF4015735.1 unnamed protein product [Didymodactylos carnosus]CAF4153874.1 unnamed protein product [Didymodactylos carnosus]